VGAADAQQFLSIMDRTAALTWSWLHLLTKKRADMLKGAFGDLDRALGAIGEEFLTKLGCRGDTVMKVLNRLEEFDVDQYEAELKKRDVHFLTIEDDAYPSRLKEIGDPPMFLYYRGDLTILDQPCIALVGTRKISPYGQRVAEAFVGPIVAAGVVTVSGLAEGIDAVVARETMRAGGKTVAALGHGLASIFPAKNARLAEEIVKGGGLLLSEFPLDTTPDKFTFPARNRIIAGLSLGTIVLEAGEGSGALITADLALDYGRDVFAVPGQIFDENFIGCHQIISRGLAKLVTTPQDVLQEVGIVAADRSTSSFTPRSNQEAKVHGALTTMPQSVGDIAQRAGLAAGPVNATLTMLELSGAAKTVGNGQWVKN